MLTLGWNEACTLGAVIPNVTITKDVQSQSPLGTHIHRMKRTPANPLVNRNRAFHMFERWFIPRLGVSELEKAIVNISAVIEELDNKTLGAI